MKLSKATIIRLSKEHVWQFTGIAISGMIAIAVAPISGAVSNAKISAIYIVSMIFMLIIFIVANKQMSLRSVDFALILKRNNHLTMNIERLKKLKEVEDLHIQASDKAFRNLALQRYFYEMRIISLIRDIKMCKDTNEKDRLVSQSHKYLEEYLTQICNTTVVIYSERYKIPIDSAWCSVKLISKDPSNNFGYITITRSENTDENRRRGDKISNGVKRSAFIIDALSHQHKICVVPNMKKYISDLQIRPKSINAPHPSAADIYDTSMSALIYLSPAANITQSKIKFEDDIYRNNGDFIFGMITFDAKGIILYDKDADIIREMSIHCLSALRLNKEVSTLV